MPEKLTSLGRRGSEAFRIMLQQLLSECSLATGWCGRLGLALARATTVPTATPAPAMMPTLIRMERARLCFAGAIAAPAGLEAATPVVFTNVAAAVPRGAWPSLCGFGEGCCTLDSSSCERTAPGLLGRASTWDGWACTSVVPLSEELGRACAEDAASTC